MGAACEKEVTASQSTRARRLRKMQSFLYVGHNIKFLLGSTPTFQKSGAQELDSIHMCPFR